MPIVSPAAEVRTTSPAQNNLTADWLNVREAGELARVSARRIHAAVRRGELRAACVDGRGRLVLHRAWVTHWLERLADASDMPSGGRSAKVRDFKVLASGECNGNGNGAAE